MQSLKTILLLIAITFCFATISDAKKKDSATSTPAKVYAFGITQNFNDSIVYFTQIQELPNAKITKGFLDNRAEYSRQLKSYFQTIGTQHETCAIIFGTNEDKLKKKFIKLFEKYQKRGDCILKTISAQHFTFSAVTDDE